MDVSVSETIDQKTYLKNLGGASAPLVPPGSAYDDCPAKMAKFLYKNTCPSVANYQSQIFKTNAVDYRSHLTIENQLKVKKVILFRKQA